MVNLRLGSWLLGQDLFHDCNTIMNNEQKLQCCILLHNYANIEKLMLIFLDFKEHMSTKMEAFPAFVVILLEKVCTHVKFFIVERTQMGLMYLSLQICTTSFCQRLLSTSNDILSRTAQRYICSGVK